MFQLRWFVLIIMVLSVVIMPTSLTYAEGLEASVEVLESGVEVMELGTKQWTTLQGDAVVSAGDHIRTDDTGYALITWFDDGTFIELQPNTELVIEEFSADDEKFMIDASLLQGSILNSVRRLINQDSGYHINTSNLTATVRGTVFSVSIDADMNTTIAVIEGTVHAEDPTNPDIFIPVEAGNFLTVSNPDDIIDATVQATAFEDAAPEYAEIITSLDDFYETRAERLPEQDGATPNNTGNTTPNTGNGNTGGNNGGGNGNGNNGNGNGNGGSNGNTNNGNGNTGGNNGGGNGNGNNGNGNGNGGSNGGSNGNGNGNN